MDGLRIMRPSFHGFVCKHLSLSPFNGMQSYSFADQNPHETLHLAEVAQETVQGEVSLDVIDGIRASTPE